MKLNSSIFVFFLVLAGCSQKVENEQATAAEPNASELNKSVQTQSEPTESETKAADEASLLAAAKEAGVSDEEALAAKAELDKVYDEARAKMDTAEAERLARMKQLSGETCIENCSGN